jgi:hypothetical protein
MSALLDCLSKNWYVIVPLFLMALAFVGLAIQRETVRSNAEVVQRLLKSIQEKASRNSALEGELAAARIELGRLESQLAEAELAAVRQVEHASKKLAESGSERARLKRDVEQQHRQIEAQAASLEEFVQTLTASRSQNVEAGLSIEALRQELDVERTERRRAEERLRGQTATAEEHMRRTQSLARLLEERARDLQESRLARIASLQAGCAKSHQEEAEARNCREAAEAELRLLQNQLAEAESYSGDSLRTEQNGWEPQASFERETFPPEPRHLSDQLTRQREEIEALKKTLEQIGILA